MPGHGSAYDQVVRAVETVAEDFQDELHDRAIEAGWTPDVAASLTLKADRGYLYVDAGESNEAARDQEFGTADGQPPRPVVGNFFLDKDVSSRLEESTSEQLGKVVFTHVNRWFR